MFDDGLGPYRKSALHEGGHVAAGDALGGNLVRAGVQKVHRPPELGLPPGETEFDAGFPGVLGDEEYAAVLLAGLYVQEGVTPATSDSAWIAVVSNRPLGDGDNDVKSVKARAGTAGRPFPDLAIAAKRLLDSMSGLSEQAQLVGHLIVKHGEVTPELIIKEVKAAAALAQARGAGDETAGTSASEGEHG